MHTEISLHSTLPITIAAAEIQQKAWHRLSPCVTEQPLHISASDSQGGRRIGSVNFSELSHFIE